MSIRHLVTDENKKYNLYGKDLTIEGITANTLNLKKPAACLNFCNLAVPYQRQLTNTNTYYTLEVVGHLVTNNNVFTNPNPGELKYIGNGDYFIIDVTLSINVNQSADIYIIALFKNGQITDSQVYFDFVSNNVAIGSSFHSLTYLNTNDVLTVRMLNQTNNNRIVRIFDYCLLCSGSILI